MTYEQRKELDEYLRQAKEISHTDTFKEDSGMIKDFIEKYGDDLSWENIERMSRTRRLADGNKDRGRRFLYRWKMWKEGVPMSTIISDYTGGAYILRACEVVSCPDRDMYGFCSKHYRLRISCQTLRAIDDLAKEPPKKPEKKEPEKADWIFNKECSYKDAACAVFKGNL